MKDRLANVRAPVVDDLYCPSSQNLIKKALHEITEYSQLAWFFFSCRWFLSNAPTAHRIITWHLGIGDEDFARAELGQ